MSDAITLSGRIHEDEMMDTEVVTPEDFAGCLRDLERVNILSAGYRPTLKWLDTVAKGQSKISVLDVGCGHGDMLRKIAAWARKRDVAVELIGIDLNPSAILAAQAATPDSDAITYEAMNLFDIPPERRPDVVISSLFCHHLTDAQFVDFVAWMEANTRLGWFINDLHRHWIPAYALTAIFAIWPVHRFVRNDGPVSVRRAFVRDDFAQVARVAGLSPRDVDIRWCFPFRWGVGRIKQGG